jgi:hypothetical protein
MNKQQAYITFEQHFIPSREEIWSRWPRKCLGEGFTLDVPRSERALELGDLDDDLIVAVLHLLVCAVMIVAGSIDLSMDVFNDVVGTLEDVIGDSTCNSQSIEAEQS